ncbi:MAG: trypsin-like peptidase domain-containing protein [Burkholderiaceae bacterium]
MLRRLWLIFAQATTIGLAALFVVASLRPDWLDRRPRPTATPIIHLAAAAAGAGGESPNSYSQAVQAAAPAVVNVYTTQTVRREAHPDDPLLRRFFGDAPSERTLSLGSGVIATSDGYVLTNNHVVQAADEIAVALTDGRRLPARLIGADPETDLALLRIDARDLPAVSFGHSEELRVGDVVLAIGNPFDVGQTVTMGIVSALGRNNLGINRFENFIQTDAAINRGNSGGALIDAHGNLVGINSAIFSPNTRTPASVGIGFAIPTTIINEVLQQLIAQGRVTRGYFGIEPEDITPELADALGLGRKSGVVIRGVARSAPAGRAGIEPGDVLVSINGAAVLDSTAMLSQIAALAPGSTAQVQVLRRGRGLELAVVVAERPIPLPRQ